MPKVGDIEGTTLKVRSLTQFCDGVKPNVVIYLQDATITEKSGMVILDGVSPRTMTLGDPIEGIDDGKELTIISRNTDTHTIENLVADGNTGFNAEGEASETLELGGNVGDRVTLIALSGSWWIHVSIGATLTVSHGLLRVIWDFTDDGGTVAGTPLDLAGRLPNNAVVTRGYYEVVTAVTGGASSIAIGIDTDDVNGLLAPTGIGSAGTLGFHDLIQDGALANFSTKTTASRPIEFDVTGADLTAGRLVIFLEYIISE
jgi:hypothetical protein